MQTKSTLVEGSLRIRLCCRSGHLEGRHTIRRPLSDHSVVTHSVGIESKPRVNVVAHRRSIRRTSDHVVTLFDCIPPVEDSALRLSTARKMTSLLIESTTSRIRVASPTDDR
jgi:hypothetical protein